MNRYIYQRYNTELSGRLVKKPALRCDEISIYVVIGASAYLPVGEDFTGKISTRHVDI